MAFSKVILNGTTLMDVTGKTVTSGSMLSGTTALKNDGTSITGSIASKSSTDVTVSDNTVTVPAGYYASPVSVTVSASGKTTYVYMGLASRTANSYGATNAKVTVTKAGTYNISYVAIRGSSSGTMGTNLHIGSSEKGNNTTWNNGTYGQYVSYTSQSISANTDVTIYATSGNNSRTIYVGNLIVQEV